MFGRYFGARFFGRRYFGGNGETSPPEALVPDPLLTLRNRVRRSRQISTDDNRVRSLAARRRRQRSLD